MWAQYEDRTLIELAAHLQVRHAQFLRALHTIVEIARTEDAADAEVLQARADLGRAIRERRSAVTAVAGALIRRGHSASELSEAAKEKLQAVAVPHLGRWSARRIADDRRAYSLSAEQVLPDIIASSQEEVDWLVVALEEYEPAVGALGKRPVESQSSGDTL